MLVGLPVKRRRSALGWGLAAGILSLSWACSSSDDPSAGDDGSVDSGTVSKSDASTDRVDASSPGAPKDSGTSDSSLDSDAARGDAGAAPDDAGTLQDATTVEDAATPGDAAASGDASGPDDAAAPADAGPASAPWPGSVCSGTLTDAGLVALYTNKPKVTIPHVLGGNTQARRLGSFTSAVYLRQCNSNTGCGEWTAAEQPAYEHFESINTAVRSGSMYLWSQSGTNRLGIVSSTVGDDCLGWTQGFGDIQRNGSAATVTLDAKVEDNCVAGADPVFYFNQVDLYDPTGVVTDHCAKLTYSKQLHRVDVSGDAYVYDEYVVVYDATY